MGCSCMGNDTLEKVIQQNISSIARYLQLHAADLRMRSEDEGLSDEDLKAIDGVLDK